MYTYNFFNLKELSGGFTIRLPLSQYNPSLVIGYIMSGKKSVTNTYTSHETHRWSIIGGVKPEPISHDNRNYLELLPAKANYSMNTDFNVQVNLSLTKTSKIESEDINYLNKTCFRTTLHTATLKWTVNDTLKVRNAAIEFADRVYQNRYNVLEKVVNKVIKNFDGYSGLTILKDYVCLRSNHGHTEHKISFIDEGLKPLNSLQLYGFALALERYMQENKVGYSLNNYYIGYFDMIEFEITRNAVLSDW